MQVIILRSQRLQIIIFRGQKTKVSWDEVGNQRENGDYMLGLELDAPVTAADIKSHFNYVWTNLVHKPTYEAGMNEDGRRLHMVPRETLIRAAELYFDRMGTGFRFQNEEKSGLCSCRPYQIG